MLLGSVISFTGSCTMKAAFITFTLVLLAAVARDAGAASQGRQSVQAIRDILNDLEVKLDKEEEKKPGFYEELDAAIKKAVSTLGKPIGPVTSILDLVKKVGHAVGKTAKDLHKFFLPHLKQLLVKINKALDEELAKKNIDVPAILKTTESELQDMSKQL